MPDLADGEVWPPLIYTYAIRLAANGPPRLFSRPEVTYPHHPHQQAIGTYHAGNAFAPSTVSARGGEPSVACGPERPTPCDVRSTRSWSSRTSPTRT